jgi:hypothetical protein
MIDFDTYQRRNLGEGFFDANEEDWGVVRQALSMALALGGGGAIHHFLVDTLGQRIADKDPELLDKLKGLRLREFKPKMDMPGLGDIESERDLMTKKQMRRQEIEKKKKRRPDMVVAQLADSSPGIEAPQ